MELNENQRCLSPPPQWAWGLEPNDGGCGVNTAQNMPIFPECSYKHISTVVLKILQQSFWQTVNTNLHAVKLLDCTH